MSGWKDVLEAVLRIAYSNQKSWVGGFKSRFKDCTDVGVFSFFLHLRIVFSTIFRDWKIPLRFPVLMSGFGSLLPRESCSRQFSAIEKEYSRSRWDSNRGPLQ